MPEKSKSVLPIELSGGRTLNILRLLPTFRAKPDEYNPHHGQPILRFKYPTNITWDELTSGGYVSQELFQTPFKEYFVFGNTGTWGKYVANDYVYPLDIIGFQKEYSEVFREHFKPLIKPEVSSKWLPNDYK